MNSVLGKELFNHSSDVFLLIMSNIKAHIEDILSISSTSRFHFTDIRKSPKLLVFIYHSKSRVNKKYRS